MTSAVQVTYENMYSASRDNVLALLENNSNVPDPVRASAEFRKWIYSRDPDVKSNSFKGYPYMVINPADVALPEEKGRGSGTVDGKSKPVSWDIIVEIVTSDRGYSGKDAKALSHMDSISNAIHKTMMNITNRNTLSGNSMKFANVISTTVVPEIIANEMVYRRSFLLGFESRIQVSA